MGTPHERPLRGPGTQGGPPDLALSTPAELVVALVDRTAEILTAHDGLRALLTANRSIVEDLSLPAVLRRVVAAAQTVAGARHAALGVVGPDGLLEEVVRTGTPVDAADDPFSNGFPPAPCGSTTSLAVPVRARGVVLGTLYLADRHDGRPFAAEDEELVLALAATAGIAIENARLYEDGRRRQDWLAAAGEISRSLLSPGGGTTAGLQQVADTVVRLAEADVAAVVLPADDPDVLEVYVVAGADVQGLQPASYPRAGTLEQLAMTQGAGVLLDGARGQDLQVHLTGAVAGGPVMALPLLGERGPRGVVVVGRAGSRPRFTAAELALAEGFASQAALALELAEARADQQRLAVLEDRNRIARDLHDHVVQRLYASGLTLQSALSTPRDPLLQALLTRTVADLGDVVRQIRTSIFALTDGGAGRAGARAAVLDVVLRAGAGLRTSPRVTFVGPLDTVVDDVLAGELTAVVNEGLTNVVRHAGADVVEVGVHVLGDRVRVVVTDDGVGLGERRQGRGLSNLGRRADQAGGTLTLTERPGGGLVLEWEVPLARG